MTTLPPSCVDPKCPRVCAVYDTLFDTLSASSERPAFHDEEFKRGRDQHIQGPQHGSPTRPKGSSNPPTANPNPNPGEALCRLESDSKGPPTGSLSPLHVAHRKCQSGIQLNVSAACMPPSNWGLCVFSAASSANSLLWRCLTTLLPPFVLRVLYSLPQGMPW